jgi:hypothetical protein
MEHPLAASEDVDQDSSSASLSGETESPACGCVRVRCTPHGLAPTCAEETNHRSYSSLQSRSVEVQPPSITPVNDSWSRSCATMQAESPGRHLTDDGDAGGSCCAPVSGREVVAVGTSRRASSALRVDVACRCDGCNDGCCDGCCDGCDGRCRAVASAWLIWLRCRCR